MKTKPTIRSGMLISAVALALIIDAIYYYDRAAYDLKSHAIADILIGRTEGGRLHADVPQIVCFDKGDIFTVNGASDADTQSEIVEKLERDQRCATPDPKSGYEVDAEGRQIYVTKRGGTVALWATKKL